MGIKDFFRKTWGKIKDGARAVGSWVQDKVVPVMGRIARVGANVISNLPGWLGRAGKIGQGIFNAVDQLKPAIPNPEIREGFERGMGTIKKPVLDTIDKWRQGAERLKTGVDNAQQAVGNAVNTVKQTLPM